MIIKCKKCGSRDVTFKKNPPYFCQKHERNKLRDFQPARHPMPLSIPRFRTLSLGRIARESYERRTPEIRGSINMDAIRDVPPAEESNTQRTYTMTPQHWAMLGREWRAAIESSRSVRRTSTGANA